MSSTTEQILWGFENNQIRIRDEWFSSEDIKQALSRLHFAQSLKNEVLQELNLLEVKND